MKETCLSTSVFGCAGTESLNSFWNASASDFRVALWSQANASVTVLPKQFKDSVDVNSEVAKQKFGFQYMGAVLEVEQDEEDTASETYICIVTAVKFVDGLGLCAVADHACETEQSMHSVEKYFALSWSR